MWPKPRGGIAPSAGTGPGGRRELDQLIGDIASTPLDRSRPLWEMYVGEGLADDCIAIIHKVHHVLADGVGSANQMAKAMEPYEPSPDVRVSDGSDAGWARAGLLKAAGRDHVGLIRKLPRLVRETTAGFRGSVAGPRSGAGIPIWRATSPRRHASSITW
jgi:hypothetical protein